MIDLMLGDCLERMREIPDGSVDLICADLPYGKTACEWDKVIPLGSLWAHYRRILTPCGSVVLTARQPFTSQLVLSNPEWFKFCLVWEKSSAGGFLDAKFRPLAAHEDIAVFSPAGCSNGSDPAMTYNPQMGSGEPYSRLPGGVIGLAGSRSGSPRDRPRRSDGARYPRSVLYFASDSSGLHPTRKPVPLMEYLVRTFSEPGATVLDNAMGSGATGEACVLAGRDFIGIEGDRAHFATARHRIESAQASTIPAAIGA